MASLVINILVFVIGAGLGFMLGIIATASDGDIEK